MVPFIGCSDAPPPEPAAGCSPVVGDDCLGPFPSSFYEALDSNSPTGMRVAIGASVLPIANDGTQVTPARLNGLDGFPSATRFIVYVKQNIDSATLPKSAAIADSVTAASTVQILDYETGDRLPVFAELDANADITQDDRQALLIQPMARFKPGKRYVIAMTGVKDVKGHALSVRPFRALRDKTALSKALTAMKDRYEEIFTVLEKGGLKRADIDLAWDVVIGSESNATGNLLAMRNEAIDMANAGTLGYTITSTTDFPATSTPGGPTADPDLAREILGTITVPNYLTADRISLNVDDSGKAVSSGLTTFNFVAHIPQCALTATGPLPVMFYGHGLFFSAVGELNTGYLKQLGQRLCMVQIGTNWLGLSIDDVADVVNKVVLNWNNFHMITDRLQQAHVNAQVLTRMFVRSIKDDAAMKMNGNAVTDAQNVYYYGISLGGTSGGPFLALSSDVSRGVLNVPGGVWSFMMYRSADFKVFIPLLQSKFPDPLDRQTIVLLTQVDWDHTDPINYLGHLLGTPFPGISAKNILMQESEGDPEVPNLATRMLVREAGIPGLNLETPVLGVSGMTPPMPSAYTQWNTHPTPLPPDADQPCMPGNMAHEAIRVLDPLISQIQAYLKPNGQVTDTCGGICSF